MSQINKYGLSWPSTTLPIQIEFYMLRQPDEALNKSGMERYQIYLNIHKILWPEDEQHRWFVQGMKAIVQNKIVCLLGCASSGKTYLMCVHALIDFFCFPQTSFSMISSTEKRSMEIKVWGRAKELYNRAKNRYGWLPGGILESQMAITADEIDEDGEFARVLNRGIICVPCVSGGRFVGMGKFQGAKPPHTPGKQDGILKHYADECFPAGTMVETPEGKRRIETIRPGDYVLNCLGKSKVTGTIIQQAEKLVEIKTKSGRKIICTPNHPFLTKDGWKSACHMNQSSYMLSAYEAMQIMRSAVQAGGESENMHALPQHPQKVRALSERFLSAKSLYQGQVLLPKLQVKMDSFPSKQKENLHSLRGGISGNGESAGVCSLSEKAKDLRSMPKSVSGLKDWLRLSFLWSVLRLETSSPRPGISKEILHRQAQPENSGHAQEILHGKPGRISENAREHGSWISKLHSIHDACGETGKKCGNFKSLEGDGAQACDSWRQWNWPDENGKDSLGSVSYSHKQFPDTNQNEGWKRLPNPLQNRRGYSSPKAGCGSGRGIAREGRPERTRREENPFLDGDWVDSVAVYKQAGAGRFGECEAGTTVYNLEVEGHPSYSVNGFLAHNCALMAPSFLDAYTNWMVSSGFKGIMAGNPTDISDPLCVASEPPGGWDAFVDNGKTQEWKSKWYGAHALAYDGRHTPNVDEPKNRFPFLVSSTFVSELLETHGEDSWQVWQQGIGKPSRGMVSWRVITMGLCEKHKAFEDVVWSADKRTRIYATDPAFGGGDRCVMGEMEFGTDIEGRQILFIYTPEVFPIKLTSGIEPEDQIAAQLKYKSDSLVIPAKNMFYDSFGRGTLGFSLAKVFGSECPVPVDAGGKPTERPVRFDLFVEENQNGQPKKRLKRCNEHYDRAISEIWFSTREAIESEQIRNLPKHVAQEGQMRLYSIVAGNKTAVETKDDMKERIKKSPDLYDWFAIGVEGARRLGFKIERIGSNVDAITKKGPDWLDKQIQEMKELNKSRRLQNA